MYKTIRRIFEQRRVKIKEIGPLIHQLNALKAEYTDEGKLKVRTEGVKIHDDYADSFALACQAISMEGQWHFVKLGKDLQRNMFG